MINEVAQTHKVHSTAVGASLTCMCLHSLSLSLFRPPLLVATTLVTLQDMCNSLRMQLLEVSQKLTQTEQDKQALLETAHHTDSSPGAAQADSLTHAHHAGAAAQAVCTPTYFLV